MKLSDQIGTIKSVLEIFDLNKEAFILYGNTCIFIKRESKIDLENKLY